MPSSQTCKAVAAQVSCQSQPTTSSSSSSNMATTMESSSTSSGPSVACSDKKRQAKLIRDLFNFLNVHKLPVSGFHLDVARGLVYKKSNTTGLDYIDSLKPFRYSQDIATIRATVLKHILRTTNNDSVGSSDARLPSLPFIVCCVPQLDKEQEKCWRSNIESITRMLQQLCQQYAIPYIYLDISRRDEFETLFEKNENLLGLLVTKYKPDCGSVLKSIQERAKARLHNNNDGDNKILGNLLPHEHRCLDDGDSDKNSHNAVGMALSEASVDENDDFGGTLLRSSSLSLLSWLDNTNNDQSSSSSTSTDNCGFDVGMKLFNFLKEHKPPNSPKQWDEARNTIFEENYTTGIDYVDSLEPILIGQDLESVQTSILRHLRNENNKQQNIASSSTSCSSHGMDNISSSGGGDEGGGGGGVHFPSLPLIVWSVMYDGMSNEPTRRAAAAKSMDRMLLNVCNRYGIPLIRLFSERKIHDVFTAQQEIMKHVMGVMVTKYKPTHEAKLKQIQSMSTVFNATLDSLLVYMKKQQRQQREVQQQKGEGEYVCICGCHPLQDCRSTTCCHHNKDSFNVEDFTASVLPSTSGQTPPLNDAALIASSESKIMNNSHARNGLITGNATTTVCADNTLTTRAPVRAACEFLATPRKKDLPKIELQPFVASEPKRNTLTTSSMSTDDTPLIPRQCLHCRQCEIETRVYVDELVKRLFHILKEQANQQWNSEEKTDQSNDANNSIALLEPILLSPCDALIQKGVWGLLNRKQKHKRIKSIKNYLQELSQYANLYITANNASASSTTFTFGGAVVTRPLLVLWGIPEATTGSTLADVHQIAVAKAKGWMLEEFCQKCNVPHIRLEGHDLIQSLFPNNHSSRDKIMGLIVRNISPEFAKELEGVQNSAKWVHEAIGFLIQCKQNRQRQNAPSTECEDVHSANPDLQDLVMQQQQPQGQEPQPQTLLKPRAATVERQQQDQEQSPSVPLPKNPLLSIVECNRNAKPCSLTCSNAAELGPNDACPATLNSDENGSNTNDGHLRKKARLAVTNVASSDHSARMLEEQQTSKTTVATTDQQQEHQVQDLNHARVRQATSDPNKSLVRSRTEAVGPQPQVQVSLHKPPGLSDVECNENVKQVLPTCNDAAAVDLDKADSAISVDHAPTLSSNREPHGRLRGKHLLSVLDREFLDHMASMCAEQHAPKTAATLDKRQRVQDRKEAIEFEEIQKDATRDHEVTEFPIEYEKHRQGASTAECEDAHSVNTHLHDQNNLSISRIEAEDQLQQKHVQLTRDSSLAPCCFTTLKPSENSQQCSPACSFAAASDPEEANRSISMKYTATLEGEHADTHGRMHKKPRLAATHVSPSDYQVTRLGEQHSLKATIPAEQQFTDVLSETEAALSGSRNPVEFESFSSLARVDQETRDLFAGGQNIRGSELSCSAVALSVNSIDAARVEEERVLKEIVLREEITRLETILDSFKKRKHTLTQERDAMESSLRQLNEQTSSYKSEVATLNSSLVQQTELHQKIVHVLAQNHSSLGQILLSSDSMTVEEIIQLTEEQKHADNELDAFLLSKSQS